MNHSTTSVEPPQPAQVHERRSSRNLGRRRIIGRVNDHDIIELQDLTQLNPHRPHLREFRIKNADPTSRLGRFWRKHVRLHVPGAACRDHLALERTFLSYLRTSLALTNFGVAYALLFRTTTTSGPPEGNDLFFRSGIPIAVVFVVAGVAVVLLGAWRFYRQQNSLSRGKIRKAGWDLSLVFGIVAVMVTMVFAAVVGIGAQLG